MARGLNRIQIIGHLGRDPEMRYTSQGTPVTNFTIAVSERRKDRDGNAYDETEWFRVSAWDKLAEICNEYLAKGRQVYVEGPLRTRKYTDRDGIERTSLEITARDIVLLGGRGEGDRGGGYGGSYGGGDAENEDDYDDSRPAPRSAPPSQGRAPAGGRNQPQPIEGDISDDEIPF